MREIKKIGQMKSSAEASLPKSPYRKTFSGVFVDAKKDGSASRPYPKSGVSFSFALR